MRVVNMQLNLPSLLNAARCAALAVVLVCNSVPAVTLSHPEVDSFNVRVGTQTFAGLYSFTTNSLLVETAEAITNLGSDIIKFYLGPEFARQYRITLPVGVTNLVSLARDEPSCRRVLDMPFRHLLAWAYPLSSWWPFDGYSAGESSREYREIYDLTAFLLTNYNNSGKTFYLGHWEGDWYLLPNYNTQTNPTSTAVRGMIDWLNNRQKAVDDAKRDYAHTKVDVLCYAEVNRARDAMANPSSSNQRVINSVVPYVTNLDCLSWSAYDGMDLPATHFKGTLDYLQRMMPTNKAGVVPGERIWIGEYGWGALSSGEQEPRSRMFIQRSIAGGQRFVLFWQIYNNEPNRSFWLIDSNQVKVPSYYLHERFINLARLQVARFREDNARLPSTREFGDLLSPLLARPLPAPRGVTVSNVSAAIQDTSIVLLTGQVTQDVYGDEGASVFVCWGRDDGGTNRNAWEHMRHVGINTRFNPSALSCVVSNLAPATNYFFRFGATNATGEAWSPSSAAFQAADAFAKPKALNASLMETGLRLTWPTIIGDVGLYTTTNFAEPVVWVPADFLPEQAGELWQVESSINDSPRRFFRLYHNRSR
jgi:hypothetical protein